MKVEKRNLKVVGLRYGITYNGTITTKANVYWLLKTMFLIFWSSFQQFQWKKLEIKVKGKKVYFVLIMSSSLKELRSLKKNRIVIKIEKTSEKIKLKLDVMHLLSLILLINTHCIRKM
jgi:hypothetical protein